jgi:hypothetical protein
VCPPAAARADLEGALLCDLKNRVLDHAPALTAAAGAAAELDCLVALARGARQLNLHRPQLTRDNVLHIKNGAPAAPACSHTGCCCEDLGFVHALTPSRIPFAHTQAATCCRSSAWTCLCPTTHTWAPRRGASTS